LGVAFVYVIPEMQNEINAAIYHVLPSVIVTLLVMLTASDTDP
jgi:hypothetical protein